MYCWLDMLDYLTRNGEDDEGEKDRPLWRDDDYGGRGIG